MLRFPKVLAELIADYCMELKLLDWIPKNELSFTGLWQNPNAILSGMLSLGIDDQISYGHAVGNPAAADWIRANFDRFHDWFTVWENPAMLETLLDAKVSIKWDSLNLNPHPLAIEMLLANPEKIRKYLFYRNPGAIDWIRANLPNDYPDFGFKPSSLFANPAAIDIIQKNIDAELEHFETRWILGISGKTIFDYLSQNPHPWAIEWLRTHRKHINWHWISTNPGIFHYVTTPGLTALISI